MQFYYYPREIRSEIHRIICRAGFVVSVVGDLGIPIKFIGVGEKLEDLRDFNAEVWLHFT